MADRPEPMVKIGMSIELSGEWVTPDLVAELAVQLSDLAARKLSERVGEEVEPGRITLGVKPGDDLKSWQTAGWTPEAG